MLKKSVILQDLKLKLTLKFSMSFGAISLLQKPNIESGHSLYFGFHAKDGCNFFPFLEKNTERK